MCHSHSHDVIPIPTPIPINSPKAIPIPMGFSWESHSHGILVGIPFPWDSHGNPITMGFSWESHYHGILMGIPFPWEFPFPCTPLAYRHCTIVQQCDRKLRSVSLFNKRIQYTRTRLISSPPFPPIDNI